MPDILLPMLVGAPMIAAVVIVILGRHSETKRNVCLLISTSLVFIMSLWSCFYVQQSGPLDITLSGLFGVGLHFQLDGFRAVYATITAFLWLVTGVFSLRYFRGSAGMSRYYCFLLLTLGATMGVFASGSLYTMFIFFELMSFTSYVLIVHDQNPACLKAGKTYLAVAVGSGMALLMGLFLLYTKLGTLEIQELAKAAAAVEQIGILYLIGGLLCVGFGAKAGVFPLHIWLLQAHPVAPAPASALLSGILTKTGIFGIIIVIVNLFPGNTIWGTALLILALLTMLLGAFLALLSVDLKRTLACSSVSQIGFILCGIAMQALLGSHNILAIWGTVLHMVNHSLLKLVLFMAAGVVYMNLHTLQLNEIRGFGRGKPWFAFSFLMGAMGISGVPLWNGYISKTLLHESIIEGIHLYEAQKALADLLRLSEAVFIITGGITVAYMLKLAVVLFVEKPDAGQAKAGQNTDEGRSMAALVAPACILALLGFFPALQETIATMGEALMQGHGVEHAIHYFSWENLKGAFISLALGGILYFTVVRYFLRIKDVSGVYGYHNPLPVWLDLENLIYRPLVRGATFLMYLICHALYAIFAIPDNFFKYISRFFNAGEQSKQPGFALTGSFSFSLLLLGLGFAAVLTYILLVALGG